MLAVPGIFTSSWGGWCSGSSPQHLRHGRPKLVQDLIAFVLGDDEGWLDFDHIGPYASEAEDDAEMDALCPDGLAFVEKAPGSFLYLLLL